MKSSGKFNHYFGSKFSTSSSSSQRSNPTLVEKKKMNEHDEIDPHSILARLTQIGAESVQAMIKDKMAIDTKKNDIAKDADPSRIVPKKLTSDNLNPPKIPKNPNQTNKKNFEVAMKYVRNIFPHNMISKDKGQNFRPDSLIKLNLYVKLYLHFTEESSTKNYVAILADQENLTLKLPSVLVDKRIDRRGLKEPVYSNYDQRIILMEDPSEFIYGASLRSAINDTGIFLKTVEDLIEMNKDGKIKLTPINRVNLGFPEFEFNKNHTVFVDFDLGIISSMTMLQDAQIISPIKVKWQEITSLQQAFSEKKLNIENTIYEWSNEDATFIDAIARLL